MVQFNGPDNFWSSLGWSRLKWSRCLISVGNMTFDGLPKQFLSSVRVFFDVLDTKQQGYIEFIDIEAKWNRENTDKLPSGWLID